MTGTHGASKSVEYRYKCKDGSYKFIHLTALNLLDDPSVEGILMNYHDISERKQNELKLLASETKYRALFENAGDYIFVMKFVPGTGPVIVDANNAAFEKHGYSREEMIGMPVINLEPPEIRQKLKERSEKFGRNEEPFVFETVHRRKDGSSFPVEISARKINIPGDEPLIITIERDISERKKNENELINYKLHLEEQVKIRTGELRHSNEQLKLEIIKKEETERLLNESLDKEKELNLLKSRFISTASHEFRTPLTSILSSAELVQRMGDKIKKERLDLHLNRIKNSVGYLSNLMGGVLNISRSDAGKIKLIFQPTNLFAHCSNLMDEISVQSDGFAVSD